MRVTIIVSLFLAFGLACEPGPKHVQRDAEMPGPDLKDPAAIAEAEDVALEHGVEVISGAFAVTDRVFRRVQEFQKESQVPNVDRWDSVLFQAAKGNRRLFLYTKTFVHVESRGNPYVVSATGCAGLMQFCFETAKGKPFELVFNTDEIFKCRCKQGRCAVSRDTSQEIEAAEHMIDRKEFPCDHEDPRFDPVASIAAGTIYVDSLRRRYRGNIYLMYLGFNSGPSLADKVFRKVKKDGNATPKQLEPHLYTVLESYYGERGQARANALLNIQFPKLKRTYRIYSHQPIFDELSPESLSAWAL